MMQINKLCQLCVVFSSVNGTLILSLCAHSEMFPKLLCEKALAH